MGPQTRKAPRHWCAALSRISCLSILMVASASTPSAGGANPAPTLRIRFSEVSSVARIGGPDRYGAHGAVWADVDGDGRDDLFITNVFTGPKSDFLFMNHGDAGWPEEASERGCDDPDAGTHGAVFADFDGDGDFDLWAGCGGAAPHGPSDLYINDGSGRFTRADRAAAGIEDVANPTRGVVAFDLENDGDLDVFCVSGERGSNELYVNRGDGTFREEGRQRGVADPGEFGLRQGVTAADVDNDGDMDLYSCVRRCPNRLWLNDGKGRFREAAAERGVAVFEGGDGGTFADVDNDGDPDLIVSGGPKATYVLRNRGSGRFSDETAEHELPGRSYTPALGDLDNDGDLDLLLTHDYQDEQVWLNDGDGRFSRLAESGVGGCRDDVRTAAFSDWDDDGDLDFVLASKRGTNHLFRNDLREGGNYLKVRLRGPSGIAGAPGSRLEVYRAGHIGEREHLLAVRESQSIYGYLAGPSPTIHFGLGAAEKVDLRVRFPGGRKVDREGVQANRTIPIDVFRESEPR